MGATTSSIAAKLAFFPPKSSYNIDVDEQTGKLRLTGVPQGEKAEVSKLQTKRGHSIIAVYVKNASSAKLTVLYTHGNAADIGQMFKFLTELCDPLCVNVMGYDYAGYGQSTGEPSEQNTYADIEAAYECLKGTYGAKDEDIILYGQSIGSGPTMELAMRLPGLRAVILQSAILSGLRVMYRMKRTLWLDIYKNVDKIQYIHCPILVIHEQKMKLWIFPTVFPDFFRHLKKFKSATEKLPSQSSGLEGGIITQPENVDQIEKSRLSISCIEKYSRPSIGHREILRLSTSAERKQELVRTRGRNQERARIIILGKQDVALINPREGGTALTG